MPNNLKSLVAKELEEIEIELLLRKRQTAVKPSLIEWLPLASPHLNWNWHYIQYICQHLDAVTNNEIKHLMIQLPPRSGKSELATIRYPVYRLEQDPKHRVVIAAYNQHLAERFSRRARKIALDRFPLSDERATAGDWETQAGGSLRAAGVGGGITGFGFDLLVIDDPVKSREQANSPTYRDNVWEWYTDDLYTRVEPGGHIILIMTRWHSDDIAGRILNSEHAQDYVQIKLPAFAEEDDPLGRVVGEPLCPERFDTPSLLNIKTVMGDSSFEALYQQNPTTAEGDIFKREWFDKRYSPEYIPNIFYKIQTVDSSFKDGVGNDYSVIATWGTNGIDYYLLDIWRDRVIFDGLIQAIKDNYTKWGPSCVLIEDAASGQSAIQHLHKNTGIPVEAYSIKDKGSKIARAEGVTPFARIGKVWLPEYASWVADWIKEHCEFPTGKYDDQVDTTSMALDKLGLANRSGLAVSGEHKSAFYTKPVLNDLLKEL